MASVVATNLKKGMCISYKGEIGKVQSLEHRTPGKGNALVMATIRSYNSGKTKDIRFASNEKVDTVPFDKVSLKFSYADQGGFHFMDENFETITLGADILDGNEDLLVDDIDVQAEYVDGKIMGIEFPPSIEMEVTESAPGTKGDTATAATKEAVLQTGLRIQVPLFVNPGDRVRISSTDKKYLSRA